ncbi:MAG: DUF6504 family protein [Anaerolineae bacterium]
MARFISEPIVPVAGAIEVGRMARGEPGVPARFTWREREYAIVSVLEAHKFASPEGGRPGAEMYVRRHYYTVSCLSGEVMTIYCERQARRANAKARWWLYTIEEPGGEA